MNWIGSYWNNNEIYNRNDYKFINSCNEITKYRKYYFNYKNTFD